MSKKVNFQNMSNESMVLLQNHYKGTITLEALKKSHKEEEQTLIAKIDELDKLRHEATVANGGVCTDEMLTRWNTTKLNNNLKHMKEAHREAQKELKASQIMPTYALVPKDIYNSYIVGLMGGNLVDYSRTGSVSVASKKGEPTVYTCEKSFKAMLVELLFNLGLECTDTYATKMATSIASIISARLDKANYDFKAKNEKSFDELIIYAIIRFSINLKAFEIVDGNLQKVVY